MKRNRKNEKGFTLIEMLIVILILGILVMVLLPRLSSSKIAANETAAQQQLNNYQRGQLTFYISHQAYGAPADLLQAQAISPGLAEQLGASGAAVAKNGYLGSASHSADVPNGLGSRWAMELHPLVKGSDGNRYFAIDSSGTIYHAQSPITQANGELSLPADAKSIQ